MTRLHSLPFLAAALFAGCGQSVGDQARKLGNRAFTPQAWAAATDVQRGAMTASLLKTQAMTHLHRKDVESLLGRPTGYYNYDTNPAYVVGPATVESIYAHGYLLVLETSKNDGKVKRVFFVPEVQ
ncbi:hypothetical protein AB2N08_02395 [Massilia aurea]|uniref:hypothetical protein n=1 Tax=Massilia aurea TaxID=373040 RepID=UPI003461F69E